MTGSAAPIQKFAQIAFKDPDSGEVDETQKCAFEVIVSTFLLTFHQEAKHKGCTMHYMRMKRGSEKRLDGEIMSYFYMTT